ncbi:hypothetical protein SAMN05216223_106148 [Actinacidiphila yanglinensis]|uniref:Secreted protein n=1 Tax=Actinacidiphila yanglinensis TaxID=310779 RepID=A0A1H6B2I8_9ACTN|nr:hypothetical protein [Actinacidiphila yanglinensis]SEG54810.1 hypothetical protein SAMN05216223_106148 [Actinacidiphila yanglinensis]
MQPSAGPALPHARSGAMHWITTAAAVGALVGAVALVQPADASPKAGGRPATPSGPPVAAPDPHAVTYPLTCAPGATVDVISHVSADLDGDGRPETIAVVRCHSDTGTPPSGVYVLSAPAHAGGLPKIAVTLVNPKDDRQISDFRLAGRSVKATVLGFSSDDTPRCCPDLRRTYTWEWRDGRYVALPGPANTI